MLLVPKLVTTAWLAAHLADPHLVILHVGRPDSFAHHIAGAQRTDLMILSVNAGGPSYDSTALAVEMLPPDVLRARLESYGISDSSTLVVYAATETDNAVTSATRIVFTLRVAGLGAHAALLDGGLAAWSAEGRPLTDVVSQATPGHITATTAPSLVVDANWVQSHLKSPGIVVIDAAGKVKSPSALQALFRSVGAAPGDTVVAYCHVGMQATAVLFAADQIGYPARLYDGSFEDWSQRKELPVVDPAARSTKSK